MILGHKKQWEFLTQTADRGKIPHGMLFYGQEKVGKKTLAIEFFKYINCESEEKPCNSCRSCRDIEKGTHPDFVIVQPQEGKKEIQISQIRGLIKKLSLRPYSAGFKMGIIDKAHLMSPEAQNCFLKLLEEPKGKAVLVLVTEYPETLLPTIISRVEKLRFSLVDPKKIEKYLKDHEASEIEDILTFSLGRPGVAIDCISDPETFSQQKKLVSDLKDLIKSDNAKRFKYAASQESLNLLLDVWLRYLRKNFLLKIKGEEADLKYSTEKLKKIIKLTQTTNFLISTTNINQKLAFENLLIKL